jgi:hypothetical protein
MDNFREVCTEILGEIKKNNPKTQQELNKIKLMILLNLVTCTSEQEIIKYQRWL